jgi:hypothetical protein
MLRFENNETLIYSGVGSADAMSCHVPLTCSFRHGHRDGNECPPGARPVPAGPIKSTPGPTSYATAGNLNLKFAFRLG